MRTGCAQATKVSVAHAAALDGLASVPVTIAVTPAGCEDTSGKVSVSGLREEVWAPLLTIVTAALGNMGYETPSCGLSVTVDGATGDAEGIGLALAAALLAATGQMPGDELDRCCFLGDVASDGTVLPCRGILAHAAYARTHGLTLVCAASPYIEDVPWNLRCLVSTVAELRHRLRPAPVTAESSWRRHITPSVGLREVAGCARAKRAAQVAVVGGHSLAIVARHLGIVDSLVRGMLHLSPHLMHREIADVALARSVMGQGRGPESFGERPLVCVGAGEPIGPATLACARHGILCLEDACALDGSCLDAVCGSLSCGDTLLVLGVRASAVMGADCGARRALSCADISCVADANDVGGRGGGDWEALLQEVCAARTFATRRRRRRWGDPLTADRYVWALAADSAKASGSEFGPDELRLVCDVARTVVDLERIDVVTAGHVEEALTLVAGKSFDL